ncbi:MAG: insulinase family protein [Syntrophaceae bacterium]|nr:insulinase family protein [Syntrophaceae bacterium]
MSRPPRSFLFFFLFYLFVAAPVWGGVVQETLPNGLRFVLIPNPGTASVSVDLWVRAGSRFESPQTNGISHFVEHLLFKGTARRTAQDISREIAAAGGYFNAYTHWEHTQLHISILPSHLDLALDVLSDVARNSLLTEEMVAKERKVILEEISLAKIYPPSYILNLVGKTLFADHTLAMPISGTEDSVKSINRHDLLQYYRRQYVPPNACLTVVGNVDGGHLPGLIRQKFGSWSGKENKTSPPLAPVRQNQFREVRERKFLDQAIVVLALQAMGTGDPDRPAFEIINAVLGSGGNSRLYQEIREKKALSYLVGSIYHPLSDTGFWGVYVGTAPQNVALVKSIIFREIARIQQEPLSPRELEDLKNYLRGRTLIRTERNSSLAEFVSQRLLTGHFELPADYLARIQAVTAEDVKRVAESYLREDRQNLIILKPYPGLRFFRNLL